jgi:hypothetical protein
VQCPACNHNGSTTDFGQPPRCPECGAFYEKALVARAKRNELAASLEARRLAADKPATHTAPLKWLGKAKAVIAKDAGRNIVFAAGISFVSLVGIALWMKPAPPIAEAGPVSTAKALPQKAPTQEPNEYALKRIGEKNVLARLKDPDSAKFQNQFVGVSGIPCGEVNSKNSFGGYTGFQRYMASGGGVVFMEPDFAPGEFESAWSKFCR